MHVAPLVREGVGRDIGPAPQQRHPLERRSGWRRFHHHVLLRDDDAQAPDEILLFGDEPRSDRAGERRPHRGVVLESQLRNAVELFGAAGKGDPPLRAVGNVVLHIAAQAGQLARQLRMVLAPVRAESLRRPVGLFVEQPHSHLHGRSFR